MKVYCAEYILNHSLNGELVDWFKFEQEKDDKWKKTDYGYFYPNGYISQRAENKVDVYNSLCIAKNEKYFDTELSSEELKELEVEMRKECVIALTNKRKQMYDSITEQIAFIFK